MEKQHDRPDESSVPPVSSLRSRFENLAAQVTAPRAGSRQVGDTTVSQDGGPPPVPRKPFMQATIARPRSMIEPAVVPSAQSLAPADIAQPRTSLDDRDRASLSGTPWQGIQHNGIAMRSISPARQAINDSPRQGSSDTISSQRAAPAARPQVPQKKPALLARFSEQSGTVLAVPVGASASKQASSTTPDSALARELPNDVSVKIEPTTVVHSARRRFDSDASWVERLRADSDASSYMTNDASPRRGSSYSVQGNAYSGGRISPKKMTRASRVDSNASWVEPSAFEEHPILVEEPQDLQEDDSPGPPPRPPIETKPRKDREPHHPLTSHQAPYTTLQTKPQSVVHAHHANTISSTRDFTPSSKNTSALSQGFDRFRPAPSIASSAASSTVSLHAPPAPAPRRSLDRRKELTPEKSPAMLARSTVNIAEPASIIKSVSDAALSDTDETSNYVFPDTSTCNRRPPRQRRKPWQIATEYDTRLVAIAGNLVCTTGYITRVWNLDTAELIVSHVHPENVKVTAVAFKPFNGIDDKAYIWLGTSMGDMQELDVHAHKIVNTSARAHKGREVLQIYRHNTDVWSLDEAGNLAIWQKASDGFPSLQSHFALLHTRKGHTASTICDGNLWIATGKEIRVYLPTAKSDPEFEIGYIGMSRMNVGDVTTATTIASQPHLVYFGHTDGKISIHSRRSTRCIGIVHVSLNKISILRGIGRHLWAAYGTGTIQAYDTSSDIWKLLKEWSAHSKQIGGIVYDNTVLQTSDVLRVVTLGSDNTIKLWDGLFEDYWIDRDMKQDDSQFCSFSEVTVSVLTWNAGAAKPAHLQHRIEDDNFLRDYLTQNTHCDFLVFGFQELVDLEDKKLTAKSFFKSKKKDASEQEHMTHQYRAWRDHIMTRVREYAIPGHDYTNLHTASMIGLFTCVFVKMSLRNRVKHVHQAEVKRGMGGHYGNKGALVLRMTIDDSSICFVNCHLAAGQTQTASRNADAAAILEAECLPSYPLDHSTAVDHYDVFTSGGDGSTVLDHELCILNGDLNYRIDTMSRDTVVKHIQQGNLSRLLERDQLLLSRKKNPGFKLRAFQEKQIQFSPTYKYNVNSNEYDTSEKRRSPAWCDRILYRGLGKLKCDEYRRWEVRVSDHRPVSAMLTCRVKRVDPDQRAQAWERSASKFAIYKQEIQKLLKHNS